MTIRTEIESRLEAASLPAGIGRRLSEDGFWSIAFSGLSLTLAADEGAELMHLYVPLFALDGSEPADFYRHALALQMEGGLPPGVMFAVDEERDAIGLYGRFEVRTLDSAAFDGLLSDLMRSAAAMAEALRSRIREGAGTQPVPRTATPAASSAAASSAEADSGVLDASNLTDDELFLQQMMQSMRV